MARDGSGNYTLPVGNPVATGGFITATWANTTLSDIATAITGSVAADGQTGMSGDLAMGTHKVTGAGDGTAATDLATVGQVPKIAKPVVSVSKVGQQTIPLSARTKITGFTDVEANYGTWWNVATDKFSPTIAGWYLITAQLYFNNLQPNAALAWLWAALQKNGATVAEEVKRGTEQNPGTVLELANSTISALVYMNGTTDYLELYGVASIGAGNIFVGVVAPDSNYPLTYFQAVLIGA